MFIIASLFIMMLVYLAGDFLNRKMPKYRFIPLIISLALLLIVGIIMLVKRNYISLAYSILPINLGLVLGSLIGLIKKK